MKKIKYLALVLICFPCRSDDTYKVFYSETIDGNYTDDGDLFIVATPEIILKYEPGQ